MLLSSGTRQALQDSKDVALEFLSSSAFPSAIDLLQD